MSVSNTEGLKALAANVDRNAYPHDEIDRNLLERAVFNDGDSDTGMVVTLDCPEFTSLCPLTKQPDFGHFTIQYRPQGYIVESKSLKLYLGSFRNSGEFHEACAARICDDIADLIMPRWLSVYGVFRPRGGIAINPRATMGDVPDWVYRQG